jgi:gamma-glutamylcyclotransferase (GGCT)/AIG2-like uncharacterized protein YtfP
VPEIFSYGSLQEGPTQVSIYGRLLRGEPDELIDCVRTLIEVPKWHKAAATGLTHYATVTFLPGSGSRVRGTILQLTDTEFAATDVYEQDSEYRRVIAALASGRKAWVYVSSGTAGSFRTATKE